MNNSVCITLAIRLEAAMGSAGFLIESPTFLREHHENE